MLENHWKERKKKKNVNLDVQVKDIIVHVRV